MNQIKSDWSRISLLFFFLVALAGTVLRSTAFFEVPLEYMNLVHAHSHVAFQGWIYTIMFLFLIRTYLKDHQIQNGRYPLQFKLTLAVVTGVLISFAVQGYAFYSILFSTFFQLLNYWFIYRFLNDTRTSGSVNDSPVSLRFVKAGLWYGLLSTLLPIGIGILSAKDMSESEAYRSLVYTFLHLQYNGWFLLVALGLFYQFLDSKRIPYNSKNATLSYWLFSISAVPSIALSLLGMSFKEYIMPLAYISAVMLGVGLFCFLRSIPSKIGEYLRNDNLWFRVFLMAFLVSFVLKTTLQCLSVLDIFRDYAFHNRFIIIAYMHLSLIGSISFLFIALMIHNKWLKTNIWVQLGSILLLLGFIATEVLLTLTGLGLFYSGGMLLVGSAAMTLGILALTVKTNSNNELEA